MSDARPDAALTELAALLDPKTDRFALFGLPVVFSLDETALAARHRDLSRRLHPDRFATAGARERVLALQVATTVNDAFRVLSKPGSRASYLLTVHGRPLKDGEPIAPELLIEFLERQEALADAKAAGKSDQIDGFRAQGEACRAAALADLARGFADFDAGGGPAALDRAAQALVAMRYHDRFLQACEPPSEIDS